MNDYELADGKCSFCGVATEPSNGYLLGKYGWFLCKSGYCWRASSAQDDRIYAGLVDCPETREAALRWVKDGNSV